jgi:hypothetical protein
VKHPLTRALHSANLTTIDVAARLGVDPKTVGRWLHGRLPYPRHREALVALTGWAEHDLWPSLHPATDSDAMADEIRIVYPHRSSVPSDSWARLFSRARREIDILAYSALFLAEDATVPDLLRAKATAGVRVRIALGDPAGVHVTDRGSEERIGPGMSARIQTALVSFQPLTAAGVTIRLHDTVLYNSLCRSDNEMLVNSHVYGRPAAHAPVLHLVAVTPDGMTATHMASFERLWETANPLKL